MGHSASIWDDSSLCLGPIQRSRGWPNWWRNSAKTRQEKPSWIGMTLGISWTYLLSVIFWIRSFGSLFFFVIPTDIRGWISRYYRCENVSWILVVSGQWWGSQLGRWLLVVAGCRHCGRFLMGTSTFWWRFIVHYSIKAIYSWENHRSKWVIFPPKPDWRGLRENVEDDSATSSDGGWTWTN